MKSDDYQKAAMRTKPTSMSRDERIANAALGLTGEAGEVADAVKKYLFQGHELDKDTMIDELGDVLWYVAYMADAIDVCLSEVMGHNVAKLRARYPEGFDPERSQNREA